MDGIMLGILYWLCQGWTSRSLSAGSSMPISAGSMSLSNKTRVNILGALHSRLDGNHIKSGEA